VKDPYQVLGVAPTSSDEEIKKAYRKLARSLHPDLNPGDKKAEDRFKEISAAYDFLSDASKRARFDAGEIDATGATKRHAWNRAHPGGGGGGFNPRGGFTDFSGFSFGDTPDDFFAEMMRRKERGRAGAHGPRPSKGEDIRASLTVPFTEAAAGVTKRVTLVSGRTVEVRIPAGTNDGQTLRLKGQGHPGRHGGETGDAFIEIKVAAQPGMTRRDLDVLSDLAVSVQEAVLGAKVPVPTIDGVVTVTVPPGSNTGSVLRLKGKGIIGPSGAKGDQLVTLKVVLPTDDAEFKKLVEKWGPRHGYDPRGK
jgi:DnaJ-class molecular chaperone